MAPGDVDNPTVGMEIDVIPMSDANSRNKCPVPTVHASPGVPESVARALRAVAVHGNSLAYSSQTTS